MIDSLEMLRNKIEKQKTYTEFGLDPKGYGLVTIHRPSNVDDPENLARICDILIKIAQKIPLIITIHPRTRKNLKEHGFLARLEKAEGLFLSEPINYVRFMNLLFNCRLVITDSGGIQEETTYLGIPCLTVRPNTERPITISHGTNRLCDLNNIEEKVEVIFSEYEVNGKKIAFWDGMTSGRIIDFLKIIKNDK